MELSNFRDRIDEVDKEIVRLFSERMAIVGEIGLFKKENDMVVRDPKRERQILQSVSDMAPEDFKEYSRRLYSQLFELSRSYEHKLMGNTSELCSVVQDAIQNTPSLFPESAAVACQGIEGAYSHQAAERLFIHPDLHFYRGFEDVFKAIEAGECRYGVLPIENSTAGSVHAVYDFMMKHDFHIVRSVRLKVDHNLLAKPGTKISDIKEIYSHEQAIHQCAEFLKTLPGVKVIACENTAVAARMAAESDRNDIAALASRNCMKYYPLHCLKEACQDQGNNHTRFICITKNCEIYPGADRTSVMAIMPNEPGSLYKLLARFYALGANLIKLESRPLPDRDFEFMFYFDLEASIYAPRYLQMLEEITDACESFQFLGSYSEVM